MLRHPRRTLAIGLALVLALVAFGFSLEGRLTPSSLDIQGTKVHSANRMLSRYFGNTAPFVILLRGKPAAIDRQGPELIRALRRDPKVTTLSPWDRGTVGRLRPSPRRALIITDFHVGLDAAVNDKVPAVDELIEENIRPPVQATQTGFATLLRSVQDESISGGEHAELVALPILLIVLLLVFRSPVAAGVPLGFGAIAVFASRGMLAIATHWFDVSALALTVCSMMGLALGVDYALLMVSRFREELASGADPIDAAWATRRTAGRTTVFAGSTLVLSMLVALFVVPGVLLASLAGTLAMVVVLTVVVATLLGPPVLVLLGPNIDRWRIGPAPNGERSVLMTVVSAALRRPAPVAAVIGGVVLVLAAPAIALKTGPFSIGQLPHDDPARQDAELISNAIGAGYEAPFTIIAATREGTIAEPQRLAVLSRWQRRIAATPGVQSVVGPEQVARAVEPLRKGLSGVLASNRKVGPLANVARLSRNLGRVANGVAVFRSGFSQAAAGAGLLAEGSGKAEEGAIAISAGLGKAAAGSQEAVVGLEKFAKGTRQLANAEARAATAGLVLKLNLPDISLNLRNNALRRSEKLHETLLNDASVKTPQLQAAAQAADEQLATALKQLEGMTSGKSDPDYAAALEAVRKALAAVSGTDPASGQPYEAEYAGLPAELTALQARLLDDSNQAQEVSRWITSETAHIDRLASVAKKLSEGLYEISKAGNKVAKTAAKIDRENKQAAGELEEAVPQVSELADGLTQLTGGTTELQRGLGEAFSRSYPLQAGTRRIEVRVQSQSENLNRRAANLRRTSPGIFNSGYFVLSALDGTRGQLHERAGEAIDLNGGGQATAITVFSRYGFNSPGSISLNKKLEDDAAALGREAGLETGVAGGPPTLNTYSRVTKDRIPYVVAAITLATFLVLILVLRALPLAAIAVGLNLVTVGVAFGILTLLTNVPDGWPLGGRTYVDAVGATMIFGIVFGLSIDYAVFLLVRMREHYDREGDNAAAIAFGLEKTARVITGAAVIMLAVFIAFSATPIATVSQLGVGLTVAVILDATVVRIVLLPALMLLIGDRVWWLPRSLERVLPRLNV
ncbi:MAG TPA: MMPL family transporter [Solirubrobacterales bacterium]|jgi:RND superfamily putative drug exporter|nr:MMPL family transporter [Solirubrobacterales bacterium]